MLSDVGISVYAHRQAHGAYVQPVIDGVPYSRFRESLPGMTCKRNRRTICRQKAVHEHSNNEPAAPRGEVDRWPGYPQFLLARLWTTREDAR